jgi:hypothetical protein
MATDRANMEEVGMPEVAEFLRDLLAGGIRRPSAHQGRPVVRQSVLLTVRLAGPKAEDGVQVSRIPEAWLARFGKALPLKQLGFSKVAQLAHAVPHVVRVVTKVRDVTGAKLAQRCTLLFDLWSAADAGLRCGTRSSSGLVVHDLPRQRRRARGRGLVVRARTAGAGVVARSRASSRPPRPARRADGEHMGAGLPGRPASLGVAQ